VNIRKRALHHDVVEVPAWVPPSLAQEYRSIARRKDEFYAAKWGRSMKRRLQAVPR